MIAVVFTVLRIIGRLLHTKYDELLDRMHGVKQSWPIGKFLVIAAVAIAWLVTKPLG